MTQYRDQDDEGKYGRQEYRSNRIRWSPTKVIFTLLLFGGSIALMITGIYPLIDMDFELKSFANILFVLLHVFYLFSFTAVKRNSQLIFWSASFLVLDAATFLFYFYDDIFI